MDTNVLIHRIDITFRWNRIVRELLLRKFRMPKPSAVNSFHDLFVESDISRLAREEVDCTYLRFRHADDEMRREY